MLYYLELKQILSLFIGFCLVLCRATCLVQFKGDPGELGDSSLDLSKYYPENKPLSRKRRIVTFAPRSLFTITNKLDVPLFSKLDGNISKYNYNTNIYLSMNLLQKNLQGYFSI